MISWKPKTAEPIEPIEWHPESATPAKAEAKAEAEEDISLQQISDICEIDIDTLKTYPDIAIRRLKEITRRQLHQRENELRTSILEINGAYKVSPNQMYIGPAPQPTTLDKYKDYFFPQSDEARWTEPDRYEKTYKVVDALFWAPKTTFKLLGSALTRANKFVTNIASAPQIEKAIATMDYKPLKEIPEGKLEAFKAFIPVPGAAEDLPTFGESLAKNWYQLLTRKEAPWWYAPAMDMAFDTILMGGSSAQKALQARRLARFSNQPLSSIEIKAAKRLYSPWSIAKKSPSEVRAMLAKESTMISLAKTEKASLRALGYTPRQIQNMTIPQAKTLLLETPSKDAAPLTIKSSRTRLAVNNLTQSIKRGKKLYKQKAAMISKEKGKRVAQAAEIVKKKTGKDAYRSSVKALAGEYSVPDFTPPQISPADEYYLFQSIRNAHVNGRMRYFRYLNTSKALEKLLSGNIPTPAEASLLQRHFGSGLVKAATSKLPLSYKALNIIFDIANIPRATLASFDLSFPLRQGGILLPGHPKAWGKSFWRMLKTAIPGRKGEEYARYFEDMAANSRYAQLRDMAGLDVTEWGMPNPMAREELFMSTLAEKIPGIRWSERTFTTMSNQLRINIFDDIARQWEAAGITWENNASSYTQLARFLNHATGRGTLGGKALANAVTTTQGRWTIGISPKVLNATFFSPKYQISRPQLIYDAFVSLTNPVARKVIIGDLVKWVGTGMVGLYLLNQIPGVTVETDPRSSDFGKVKYGKTRYDYWSGFQQMARLVAQVITAQGKTTGTKKVYNLNRKQVIERFIRMKMSPAAGLIWDVLEGVSPMGERLAYNPLTEPFAITEQALRRVIPLVIQDIYDAARLQGLDASFPVTSTTAFFGVGVQTWDDTKYTQLVNEQNHTANEYFGVDWDELTSYQQEFLQRENKTITNLKREAAYERTVFPFLEEMKNEQLAAGDEVAKKLPEAVQNEFARLKIRIGSLPRTWGDWTLNDNRFALYKKYIVEFLNQHLTDKINSSEYQTRSPEQQIRIIDNLISASKNYAKSKVRAQAARTAPKRKKRKKEK